MPNVVQSSSPGFTIWLTGCPGAGKTTLARAVADELRRRGRRVEVLDGDDVRQAISPDLGFSREDRALNVVRLGFMARLLSRNGVAVIVAAVSPFRDARDTVHRAHEAPFFEVFVDCAPSELLRRDQKSLYSRAARGEVQGLTGVSAPYEQPMTPSAHIRTDLQPVDGCTASIIGMLERERVLPAALMLRGVHA